MLGESAEAPALEAPTLNAFMTEFMDTYVSVMNKHSEVESKKSIFKLHLQPAFGATRLDRIDRRALSLYLGKKLGEGLSAKTVNNTLTVLYCLLREAKRRDLVRMVPDRIWARVDRCSFRYLSFEEAIALHGAASPAWKTMILLALKTGMRLGELLALRWTDVDFAQRQVNVCQAVSYGKVGTPKSNKPRSISMTEEVWGALRAHRHLRGPLVFCRADGKPLTKGQCQRPLWRAGTDAQMKRFGWHVLRHTFASHLAILGASIRTIQELLGHSDIRVTMRYAHLSPEARKSAVLLLDAAPGAPRDKPMANGDSDKESVKDLG